MFEDTKDIQNNAHTIKIEQHEPKQKPGVNSCSREG